MASILTNSTNLKQALHPRHDFLFPHLGYTIRFCRLKRRLCVGVSVMARACLPAFPPPVQIITPAIKGIGHIHAFLMLAGYLAAWLSEFRFSHM
ncbi:hypothetical protein V8F06_000132 [Rhypophila decipiens]